MKTQALHFYTTGEGFTDLLLDFYRSGEFEKFELLLKDGNLKEEQLLKAFSLQMTLTGTTRDGEELECHFNDKESEDFNETLYFSVLTAIRSNHRYEHSFLDLKNTEFKEDKNIKVLLKYFSIEDLFKKCWKNIIQEEGFTVTTLYNAISSNDYSISGLILDTGEFVKCGYQQHRELWPVLCELGKVEGDGHLSSNTIAVSSNQLVGNIAFGLQSTNYDIHNCRPTIPQIEALWEVREYNLSHYSSRSDNRSINAKLLLYYVHYMGLGGKYGNLEFLRKFFPKIKIASYSKVPNMFWESTIVRTSPEKSMPGLLNSIKIESGDEEKLKAAVSKIKATFEIYKDTLSKNKLHWFYQKFIEGKNGVVNCVQKTMDQYPRSKNLTKEYIATLKYDIEIACSTNQGAIVEGYMTNTEISPDNATYLRRVSRDLAEIFHSDLQLEFVVTPGEEVIIVQLRLLGNRPNLCSDIDDDTAKSALITGRTFCSPTYHRIIEVSIDEILIVEQDCKSEELLGKKALIVENDTNFSHILALSKAMNIPSIYGTGKVILDGKNKFTFNTEYTTGYIK